MKKHFAILTSLSLFLFSVVSAHDGSQLWLQGSAPSATSTLEIANAELNQSWKGAAPVLKLNKSMKALPDGSFSITIQAGMPVIQSASEVGLLYGAYHLIRMQQTGANVRDTALVEQPSYNTPDFTIRPVGNDAQAQIHALKSGDRIPTEMVKP